MRLGLRENLPQFVLLVFVNALVGAMIGLERSILPKIAGSEFGLSGNAAILSFIVVFGVTKAVANYFAGWLADSRGRKPVLLVGWVLALPVPILLMTAQSWSMVLLANALLGVSQGLTWSTTVIMKIDLVGPHRRGLAMGWNEFAGYLAVAGSAALTAVLADRYGLRPAPFVPGIFYAVLGLVLVLAFVHETRAHAELESRLHHRENALQLSQRDVFLRTTVRDRNLSAITQAGLVNNLNDGMAWGLFPILYASLGLDLVTMGWLAGVYPAIWGVLQLWTGHLSDVHGRKPFIAGGMLVQAIGIAFVSATHRLDVLVAGNVLLGAGTAMVYPTLLAAIGDVAHPTWRASAVGVYRLWRDLGYAIGAVVAGAIADLWGVRVAIAVVALITAMSGVVVMGRMGESRQ